MERPGIQQQVTFFHTPDLEASATFYENVLGFECVLDQGACRIYRVVGDAFVGFCSATDAIREGSGASDVILTLVTCDVDEWVSYLDGHGVALDQPPKLNARFDIYHCFLRDPAGHLIEIQRFNDSTWPAPLGAGPTV